VTHARIRGGIVAALLAATAALAGHGPAQAIPPGGQGQSVTYTFYSDATRSVEVGWWSYGDCGEPFDIGTHTSYFRIRYVSC
jgi:hypothetical protein